MHRFEILRSNGLARLGKLYTPHGIVITPELMPVYNPNIPLISTDELIKDFNVKILITNAYIIFKTKDLREQAEIGVHNLIEFKRTIMLDSGAYQAWIYDKNLDVTNKEIIEFQQILKPDIATILDIFTETDDYNVAKEGVIETINRAKECIQIRDENNEIMWAAPIQGGKFMDLVRYSAIELSKLDFDYHPIGTLAPALMSYNYRPVLDGIATAKLNMDRSRPLHAFSIGHPMFFALSVLFGSDLFDSSSYALYAKDNRYLTPLGTLMLNEMEEFPCSCPTCLSYDPKELLKMDPDEKTKNLAKHNLYTCLNEMKNIREAIKRDKLWELVQSRVRSHPNLLDAYLYTLHKYRDNIEMHDPITKRTAFFYVGLDSLSRPEIIRHKKWLFQRYTPPDAQFLIILPDIYTRPIESHHFKEWYDQILEFIANKVKIPVDKIHFCILSPIFGPIPIELSDTYPYSQYLYPNIFYEDLSNHISTILKEFIEKSHEKFNYIIILYPTSVITQLEIFNYPKIDLNILDKKILNMNKVFLVESIDSLKKLIQKLI